MRAGVWTHRPLHTCTLRGRPEADLASLIQEQTFQSNPVRAAQSLTSPRLRLIPRRRFPISCPTWRLVRIRSTTQLRSNTKISLSVLINVTADADQGQAHLSPRWSQPALSLRHKVTLGGCREPRPTTMEPPVLSAPHIGITCGYSTSRPDFSHHMYHIICM